MQRGRPNRKNPPCVPVTDIRISDFSTHANLMERSHGWVGVLHLVKYASSHLTPEMSLLKSASSSAGSSASGDPFYVFKEYGADSAVSGALVVSNSLCAAFSAVSSRAKCRLCIKSTRSGRASGTRPRPPAESCRRSRAVRVLLVAVESRVFIVLLFVEISAAVASAEKSLKFLEQTIVMVEANRSKFDHIDNVGLSVCGFRSS